MKSICTELLIIVPFMGIYTIFTLLIYFSQYESYNFSNKMSARFFEERDLNSLYLIFLLFNDAFVTITFVWSMLL